MKHILLWSACLLAGCIPALADTTCDPKHQNCSSDASYRYGALTRTDRESKDHALIVAPAGARIDIKMTREPRR